MEPHRHGGCPRKASDDSAFTSAVYYALSRPKMELKTKQVEAIRLVYECKDAFVWLPSGYRKSICFQILPYLLRRISAPPSKRSVILVVFSSLS